MPNDDRNRERRVETLLTESDALVERMRAVAEQIGQFTHDLRARREPELEGGGAGAPDT